MAAIGHDESTLNRLPELPTPAAGRTGSGWLEALACVALAALSLLWAAKPTYDPTAWLVTVASRFSTQMALSPIANGPSGCEVGIVVIPLGAAGLIFTETVARRLSFPAGSTARTRSVCVPTLSRWR